MEKIEKYSFQLIIILIVLVSHVYVIVSPANSLMNWFTTDDAFYYYKVAQNISEGYGSTFDRIGMTNGYHPLWMLICTPIFALARFDLILPLRIVVGVMAILHAATGILLYQIFKKVLSREIAVLASLLWVLSTTIHATTAQLGMESGISAFFIVLLLDRTAVFQENMPAGRTELRQIVSLSIIAILTILSRLDNIFLVGFIGLWMLFREVHIRTLLIGDIVLIIASVFGSYIIRLGLGHTFFQYASSSYVMLLITIVLSMVSFYLIGLYHPPRIYQPLQLLMRSIIAVTISNALLALLMLGIFYIGFLDGFPRSVLLINYGLTLGLIVAFRMLFYYLSSATETLSRPGCLEFQKIEWKAWLKRAVAYFAPIGLALVLYWLYNLVNFGTAMPVSGQIKRWWSTLPNTVYGYPRNTLQDFLGLDPNWDVGPWAFATSQFEKLVNGVMKLFSLGDEYHLPLVTGFELLALLLVILLIRTNWEHFKKAGSHLSLLPLFAGCMVQIMAYKATGYSETIRWYWVSELVFIVMMTALLLDLFIRLVKKRKKNPLLLRYVIALAVMGLMLNFAGMIMSMFPQTVPERKVEGYLWGAHALEERTEAGSLIGSTGGGVIGYFIKDRTVVNLDGLISSYEYFKALEAYEGNAYLDRIGLDYIYGNAYMITDSDPYMNMFRKRAKFLEEVVGSALFRYMPEGWEKQYE